ncbi:MAG: response regulator transcription factor [Chloroflexi bacterium]|nr:response regulator transcription factor [Chloroflexota bacterium]
MATREITLFIVDEQPLFRLGLKAALGQAEGMLVVGESTLSQEAVDLVSSFQPRVVILGTAPTRHRFLDFCRHVTQRCPGMPVICMTTAEESGELFEAIRSGAWGYLSKQATVETVLQAIRKVVEGEMPLQETITAHPEVGRRLLEEFQTMSRDPRLREVTAPLSQREMELLRLLGQGRSNKEIAHTLSITPQTVKNHMTSILRKLDVNDRTQAVLAGLRYGWIALEDAPADGGEMDLSIATRN